MEIKHCPFCGGEAEVGKDEEGAWRIQCKRTETCGAVGNFIDTANKMPIQDVPKMIEAWNKRRTNKSRLDGYMSSVTFQEIRETSSGEEDSSRLAKWYSNLPGKKVLKPCPFCGGQNFQLTEIPGGLQPNSDNTLEHMSYHFEEGHEADDWILIVCEKCLTGVYFLSAETTATKKYVKDRWNRRNGE